MNNIIFLIVIVINSLTAYFCFWAGYKIGLKQKGKYNQKEVFSTSSNEESYPEMNPVALDDEQLYELQELNRMRCKIR